MLQAGDSLLVPERQYTVQVTGEVGFLTALVFAKGRDIDWYVKRADGYLELADKKRTRVVHSNGMSQPNGRGHRVSPGSTIVVPVQAPPGGADDAGDVAGDLGDHCQCGDGLVGD